MRKDRWGGEKEDRVFARALDAAMLFRQLERAGATVCQIAEEGVQGSEIGREWREKYGHDEEVWRTMFAILENVPRPTAEEDPRVPRPRVPDVTEDPARLRRWAEELEAEVGEAVRLVHDDTWFAVLALRAVDGSFRRAQMATASIALCADEERLSNREALAGYAAALITARNRLLEAVDAVR